MGLRVMPESAKHRISRNVLAKKICRMKKVLRTLRISKTSLGNTNKELVLTVQSLKENLREAENKLRCQNGELCNAIAVRNVYQESHQKLALCMQELTGVVAKVCGVLSETTVRASNAFHTSGFQDTTSNYEHMRQTSETVNDTLLRIREFDRTFTTGQGNAAAQCVTLPSIQNGTGEQGDRNISDNSPDSQPNKTIHFLNGTHLPPNCYHVSVKPPLSPVEEQTSQLTDYSFMNTNEEESIDDPDNDGEYYESADDESVEQKPVLLIPKSEVIEETYDQSQQSEQFPDDHEELVQPPDAMREQFPEDHEIQPQPPDVAEQFPEHESFEDSRNGNRDVFQRTTLPYPGSEVEISVQNGSEISHQPDVPVPSSPVDPLSEVENLSPSLTASATKFSKVFPRRKKWVTTINETMESEEGTRVDEEIQQSYEQEGDAYNKEGEQNQKDGNIQEKEEKHQQQIEQLPVVEKKEVIGINSGLSEEKNCLKEDSISKPSTSPSRVSIQSLDTPIKAEGLSEEKNCVKEDSISKPSTSPSRVSIQSLDTPVKTEGLSEEKKCLKEDSNVKPSTSPSRVSIKIEDTPKKSEDTPSKEKNTRKKKTFHLSKRGSSYTRKETENGLEDTPPEKKEFRKKKTFSQSSVSSYSMKRTVSELEDTPSKEENTGKKKKFHLSKRLSSDTRKETENGLEDTPSEEKQFRKKKTFSPSRKSPRILINQLQDRQRRTRKVVKNYAEPSLIKKMRR